MSLRHRAATGVTWTAIAFAVQMSLRIVILAVLARLLSPGDFGLIATLSALIAIMQAFGDLGLSAAIVQRRELDGDQLSSVFWLIQIVGAGICLSLWLAAPLVVAVFREPHLETLVCLLSLRFVLAPPGVPFHALMQRELEFRRIAGLQIIAAFVTAVVTLGAAYEGAGVHALVWGELAGVFAHSGLVIAVGWHRWRPVWRLRRSDLRGYVRFGAHQVGERAFNQVAMNIDYLLIGLVLGSETLGLYSVAFELASLPTRAINPMFTRVAFPVFARVQHDDAALGRGYVDLSRMLALIQFPLLAGVAVLAPLIVPVFLGAGWTSAISLIQVLSVLGALRVVCNPAGSAFLAKGRSKLGFRWAVFTAIVNVTAFTVIVGHGAEAIAWTWVILIAVYWLLLTVILRSLIRLPVGGYLRAFVPSLSISALLVGVLVAGGHGVDVLGWTDRAALGALIAAGAVVTAALIWRLEGTFVATQLRLLRRREAAR